MRQRQRILWIVFLGLMTSTAFAGIYKCVDGKGRTLFSQTPCPDSSVRGNDKPQQLWRSMRAMVAEGRKLSMELQGDVESIHQCQEARADFHGRLDSLKADARALSLHHEHLYRAHEYLYMCGECRYAALSYCDKANEQLDEAMSGLK